MNKLVAFLVVILFSNQLFSQQYYGNTFEEFGQNRIQTKSFNWRTMNSNNFEFNFYKGGERLGKLAAEVSENEYNRITDIIGYTPYTVMKIFIFNSPKDQSQSNIGLNDKGNSNEKALVNQSHSRIEVSYEGNDSLFSKKIIQEISNLFVYDMLYGGNLKDALQSSILLSVPEWFTKGISAYISESDNASQYQNFKTAIQNAKSKKLDQLKGDQAAIVGQSIWFYIASQYGIDNIANILNLTRIIRNEQASVTSTLGIPFNDFLKNWKEFYSHPNLPTNLNTYKNQSQDKLINSDNDKNNDDLEKTDLKNLGPDDVDTENYVFDKENLNSKRDSLYNDAQGGILSRLRPTSAKEKLKIEPIRAFNDLLISTSFNSKVLKDPVRGASIGLELILNDLLENHQLKMGGFANFKLKNNDVFVEYTNFTNRVDWGISFYRRSIDFETIDDRNSFVLRPYSYNVPGGYSFSPYRRLVAQQITGFAHYPFSDHLRFQTNLSLMNSQNINQYFYSLEDNQFNTHFIGTELGFVYDNSEEIGINRQVGTKAKLIFNPYFALDGKNQNFSNVKLDVRTYQPLIRGLIFAGRFFYGRSFGASPKSYFLGGQENTLNRSVYNNGGNIGAVPPDMRNILFYNFPGNLRGFDFARLYGQNACLFNLELRFAVADFINNSSLSSSFIKNFQIVGFSDIGSAWNGNFWPLNESNSLNTTVIRNNPFLAEVTNFKNPFLVGMGAGVRTTLLGFYTKFDFAWGKEEKDFNKPIYYISLGHDF